MKLRKLGNTGLFVSELCLGTMNFGAPDWGIDESESLKVFSSFFDRGGNFIDTADTYGGGTSERICAKAIKGKRDSVIVATKGHFPVTPRFGDPLPHSNAFGSTRRHLTLALDDSLRRLETDYIDLYQVHCWDSHTPIEETLSTLDRFVQSGKVRYVGLSNFDAWQIVEARHLCIRHGWEPFVTAQMQYSLVCRDIERSIVDVCERYNIGLMPWSPLGGGILTGKYKRDGSGPAGARFTTVDEDNEWRKAFVNERNHVITDKVGEIASRMGTTSTALSIAWLLGRSMVSSVIIGPKSIAQLEDNNAACELSIAPDDLETLNRVSRTYLGYPEKFIMRNARNAMKI